MTSNSKNKVVFSHIIKMLEYDALQSPDKRKKVAACVIDLDGNVLAKAFNSRPEQDPNYLDCVAPGGMSDPSLIHAEEKCLLQLRTDLPRESLTMFITHCACKRCASRIYYSGIRTIVYAGDHDNGEGGEYFRSLGGITIQI